MSKSKQVEIKQKMSENGLVKFIKANNVRKN